MGDASNGILMSLFLRVAFLLCQYLEYENSTFSMSDGVFGSVFFSLTGFHGFHVMIGVFMLGICWMRLLNADVLGGKGVRHDCFIWYWHFVDVVWLILFMVVYINVSYVA